MAVHVLDAMARGSFEEVIAMHDHRSGLRAFLTIHDTSLGPAFGGIRRFAYRDEKTGLLDCLRLARAMSMKCALAGVAGGGGKLVLFDAPSLELEPAYRYIGGFIERLAGRYFAGPDVGTGARELAAVAERTSFITRPEADGLGDLAAATAAGVFAGMVAALRQIHGEEAFEHRTVVIQGLGSVGWLLAERLRELGARVLGADLDEATCGRAQAELGVEILPHGSEMSAECDVFAPCAMGGVLHDLSIQRLGARIVCGAANNPIARSTHAEKLHQAGVLYMPDIVVNAGALILGAGFHLTGKIATLEEIEQRIGRTSVGVLERAARAQSSPFSVAQAEAERRIGSGRGKRDIAHKISVE